MAQLQDGYEELRVVRYSMLHRDKVNALCAATIDTATAFPGTGADTEGTTDTRDTQDTDTTSIGDTRVTPWA